MFFQDKAHTKKRTSLKTLSDISLIDTQSSTSSPMKSLDQPERVFRDALKALLKHRLW